MLLLQNPQIKLSKPDLKSTLKFPALAWVWYKNSCLEIWIFQSWNLITFSSSIFPDQSFKYLTFWKSFTDRVKKSGENVGVGILSPPKNSHFYPDIYILHCQVIKCLFHFIRNHILEMRLKESIFCRRRRARPSKTVIIGESGWESTGAKKETTINFWRIDKRSQRNEAADKWIP